MSKHDLSTIRMNKNHLQLMVINLFILIQVKEFELFIKLIVNSDLMGGEV